MASVLVWLKKGLLFVGVVALAIAALVLLLPLAIVIRPMAIVALVAGATLYCCSPRFRGWLETVGRRRTP